MRHSLCHGSYAPAGACENKAIAAPNRSRQVPELTEREIVAQMQQHGGGNVARASALPLRMLAAQERQLAKILSRLENDQA